MKTSAIYDIQVPRCWQDNKTYVQVAQVTHSMLLAGHYCNTYMYVQVVHAVFDRSTPCSVCSVYTHRIATDSAVCRQCRTFTPGNLHWALTCSSWSSWTRLPLSKERRSPRWTALRLCQALSTTDPSRILFCGLTWPLFSRPIPWHIPILVRPSKLSRRMEEYRHWAEQTDLVSCTLF